MGNPGTARRNLIAAAIATELDRQAVAGSPRIDTEALADAIERALGGGQGIDEGKRPEELNATNDD